MNVEPSKIKNGKGIGAKPKKVDKPEPKKKPTKGLDEWGFRIGTKSHRSAEMLLKGGKLADMTKAIQKEFGTSEAVSQARVLRIANALGHRGYKVTRDKETDRIQAIKTNGAKKK